jgi:hypothetical protein
MLSESEAVKIATDHLKDRKNVEFLFNSATHIFAASRPGRYKVMGDTWVVRFERSTPPNVVESGFTIVHVDSETGRIVHEPT